MEYAYNSYALASRVGNVSMVTAAIIIVSLMALFSSVVYYTSLSLSLGTIYMLWLFCFIPVVLIYIENHLFLS